MLDALPSDFPLSFEAPTGKITSPRGGDKISVDLVYEDEPSARAGWLALQEQATARGFTMEEAGTADRREHAVLSGPGGRLKLSCCPQRVDRSRLILVSWWPPDAPGE
ncbi:MAG TPA: hypothetical protein ENK18_07725 [Deltaproteobacteria bacterium]|nr:hypothetical protein [Deltaproteobacteria bacterium]